MDIIMKKTTYLFYVIGALQIILGLFHLFAPELFLRETGHTIPEADIYVPLAMLAARFLAVGAVFIYLAKTAEEHALWFKMMIMIQVIDLGAGIFYTINGVVNIADSGIAMFNATWIIVLLALWMPKEKA